MCRKEHKEDMKLRKSSLVYEQFVTATRTTALGIRTTQTLESLNITKNDR